MLSLLLHGLACHHLVLRWPVNQCNCICCLGAPAHPPEPAWALGCSCCMRGKYEALSFMFWIGCCMVMGVSLVVAMYKHRWCKCYVVCVCGRGLH